MYDVRGLMKAQEILGEEINTVTDLLRGMDQQLNVGNISLKDDLRLKAFVIFPAKRLSGKQQATRRCAG
jgi:hypothetical protein